MSDPQEFNFPGEVMEQLRELNRRMGDVATAQAKQPTREDLQAYVLKEVFDLEVRTLREKDDKQQEDLEELKKNVQTQLMRWLTQGGVIVSLMLGIIYIIHAFTH